MDGLRNDFVEEMEYFCFINEKFVDDVFLVFFYKFYILILLFVCVLGLFYLVFIR